MPEAAVIDMPGAKPVVLRMNGVSLRRSGRTVLDGLSFALYGNGLTAVMGPNGAGKSLTLRLLAGLITPDLGTIWFAGGRPSPQELAIVFQKPVLLRRTVAGNLDHALKTYGVARRDRSHRIADLLAMAGLSALAQSPARRLSGGEQQRVALVRALAVRPRILLLDEPTASLDPQSTKAIEDLIRNAVADKVRVVLVTHDRGQAARLADDIVFLNAGRAVESAAAARFLEAPASPEARAYLSGTLVL